MKLRDSAKASQDKISAWWDQQQEAWNSHLAKVRQNVDEKKAEHDAKRAAKRAENAERTPSSPSTMPMQRSRKHECTRFSTPFWPGQRPMTRPPAARPEGHLTAPADNTGPHHQSRPTLRRLRSITAACRQPR